MPKPFKRKGSPHYHFDFQIKGRRFCGSTRCTSYREADQITRAEWDKAKEFMKRPRGEGERMTLDEAALRYWEQVAQHQACADEIFVNLDRLVTCQHLTGKRLCDITDDDLTRVVAWRRGHRKWGRADMPLVSPATVNRSATEVLQKIFTRAKKRWGARFDHEPDWNEHMLPEDDEHVRELRADEDDAIQLATRPDQMPFVAFAQASGLRFGECLLKWSEVDWDARLVTKKGKGGRTVRAPITSVIEGILRPLVGHHPESVFTYIASRTDPRKGLVKGKRYPLTYEGAKTAWRRAIARSGVKNFRFHDYRHDLATKLLRETGNLKTVQKALNHANIKTTTRYAHVLDDEVARDLETVQKSRKLSRSAERKAG
jgi:integrase